MIWEKCDKALERATRLTEKTGGGITAYYGRRIRNDRSVGFLDQIVCLKRNTISESSLTMPTGLA